jgi:hypothetical protein
MEERLDRRWWWWLLGGEERPLGRWGCEMTGLLALTPALLTSCDRGRGASVGSDGRPSVFLPLFSLKLRESPGRPASLIGELAEARSGFLGVTSLALAERRNSVRPAGFRTGGFRTSAWPAWLCPAAGLGMDGLKETASMLID